MGSVLMSMYAIGLIQNLCKAERRKNRISEPVDCRNKNWNICKDAL